MKCIIRFTLILLASGVMPWHSCEAGDGTVTGDTRYKYSQSDKTAESVEVVQIASTRQTRRVTPRRKVHSWRLAHWYYSRAAEIPWWPNAPGD